MTHTGSGDNSPPRRGVVRALRVVKNPDGVTYHLQGESPWMEALREDVRAEQQGEGGWTLRDGECPVDGAVSMDTTTGEIVWRPTCKSARCPRCSRQVSAQTFALARRATEGIERVRFITLTRAPEGWQETRQAMWVWLKHLRRAGYTMHVLWVVEEGSETGMRHVHVVQWGSFIPKDVLSASWPYGSTQIEAARAATNYLAKGVIRYVAKGIDGDEEAIEEHMNLNGGRAAHWSREFYGGLSRDGYRKANPLPGIYFVQGVMPDKRQRSLP